MYAIRSYYVFKGEILAAVEAYVKQMEYPLLFSLRNTQNVIKQEKVVITSYSIHYTKLYEGSINPHDEEIFVLNLTALIAKMEDDIGVY